MTDRFSKAFKASIIVHIVVIVLLLIVPVLMRWFNLDKKKEEIVFIELVNPAPPAPVTRHQPEPRPEPEPEPEPEKPEPKPDPRPEPPKLKEPKQIKVNTNRVVRKPDPKPAPAPKPRISEDELRKQLLSSLPTSADAPVSSSANANELSVYYGTIYRILDDAWVKPPGVSGLETEISIRIARNGGILQRKIVSKSGSTAMDDSVMEAVRSVATFPKLPDSVRNAYIDVTIKFESTGLSM